MLQYLLRETSSRYPGYGRSCARSQSVDAITGDALDGASGLAQSHVQATAGHRVPVGGLVAVPSASLFAGSLEHDARTAQGEVLRTESPGFTQGYHGWKAGLSLGTEDWLSGSGRLCWRPHLRAEWERLMDEGPEMLAVRKADRAGVLSFESEERVAGLPGEALRLDLGAELRGGSDAWGVGVGYSGAWTDGAPEHAVQARFSLRFRARSADSVRRLAGVSGGPSGRATGVRRGTRKSSRRMAATSFGQRNASHLGPALSRAISSAAARKRSFGFIPQRRVRG